MCLEQDYQEFPFAEFLGADNFATLHELHAHIPVDDCIEALRERVEREGERDRDRDRERKRGRLK